MDIVYLSGDQPISYSSLNVVAGLATAALNIVPLVVEMPITNINSEQKKTVKIPTLM